jgi:hydroxyacylglutathione hydrolase
MKKIFKRILWGSVVLIGLIIVVIAVFLINFLAATKSMTPEKTGAINDSVWCIKDKFVNAYIFKGKTSYLMIDAGIGEKGFRNEMMKTGIKPEQIGSLFLTHTDGDHIGAIALFRNASIYMHRDEEQMINGTTGKTKYSKTKWKFGPYILLGSNDTLTIDGLKIKILHTPGHTPGSSCFIVGDNYLVSGDNLIYSDGRYEHFVEKFNMNTPEQLESLKMLPDPNTFRYILTAHHGIVRTDRK